MKSLDDTKFDPRSKVTLDEVKAEVVFRSLVPSIIERGGISGDPKKWAVAGPANILQVISDQNEEGDHYFLANCFILNTLFESGAIEFDGKEVAINDYEKYYEIQKNVAEEVLSFYKDQKNSGANTLRDWVRNKCKPSEKTRALADFVKTN